MPPQFYILHTLSEILQGSQNTADQRARVFALANGLFGRMIINPVRFGKPREDGTVILTYEGDETRGGSKGRLHRIHIKLGENAVGLVTDCCDFYQHLFFSAICDGYRLVQEL